MNAITLSHSIKNNYYLIFLGFFAYLWYGQATGYNNITLIYSNNFLMSKTTDIEQKN